MAPTRVVDARNSHARTFHEPYTTCIFSTRIVGILRKSRAPTHADRSREPHRTEPKHADR